ncbi:MAG: hypothetical protein DBY25_07555 [Clostridiales bacterium]|nr:MAG: hypothetical protein DBY25_07555 [Clostridiales bacterium]
MEVFTMQCEIARQFFEMLSAIAAEQKIPREYCGGYVLYRAEINLLEKIEEYPESNVSMLSVKSGVTKSAVTQMSIKLLEKGLIERYQSPKNKKEKYFRLTPAGQEARKGHAEYNQKAADQIRSYLCSLNSEEKRTILGFMEVMRQYMPLCTFPCQCNSKENSCFLAEQKRMEESC